MLPQEKSDTLRYDGRFLCASVRSLERQRSFDAKLSEGERKKHRRRTAFRMLRAYIANPQIFANPRNQPIKPY